MRLDLNTLATAYAAGTSPTEVLRAVHARIAGAALSPVWISLVSWTDIAARIAAIEAARAAGADQPLFGIPFAVKDNIDVAGLPTTAACPDFAYTPSESAAVVRRLEAAGAVLIGKTNLDQFATGLVGTRSPYGVCASVFSAAHVSGGSSSGSAVAVASGLVSFALGTDTAGSGRVPAAFNNIVGLKPTRGLISTRGVLPACRTLDCVSIFAGCVGDAAQVLRVAEGFDAADAFSRAALPQPAWAVDRFRFGVPAGIAPDDPAAAELHSAAIENLVALGGTPVNFDFTPFAAAGALLYQGPWVAERLAVLRARGFTAFDKMDPTVAGIIAAAATMTAVDAFTGHYALAAAQRTAAAAWQAFDVMVLPTAPCHPTIAAVQADPVGVNASLGRYTNFVNLLDLCACAVPAGLDKAGMPYGVTLVAPAFADAALARLAAGLHHAQPNATLGGTELALPAITDMPAQPSAVTVAVVGAHLSGQPLNHQLTSRGGILLRTTRTAAGYALYALANTTPEKPGLVRDGASAGHIEVELWQLSLAAFGAFIAEVPAPLAIGTVSLADGSNVKGFVCEPAALAGATDITAYGGWRNWRGRVA